MTDRDDHRLVELLYDEVSQADAESLGRALREDREAAAQLDSLEATLGVIRSVPLEDPPAFLDAKILAEARQVAATADRGWWRRMVLTPAFGLAVAGATASVAAILVLPVLQMAPADREPMPVPAAAEDAPAPVEADEASEDLVLQSAKDKDGVVGGLVNERRRAQAKPRRRPPPRPAASVAKAPEAAPAAPPPAPAPKPTSKAGRASSSGPPAPPREGTRTRGASLRKEASAAPPRSEKASPPRVDDLLDRESNKPKRRSRDLSEMARTFIEAARQKERAGEIPEARRILERARLRVRSDPSEGTVLLQHAQLELRQGQPARAADLARAALRVSGFKERSAARRVISAAEAQGGR